MTILIVLLMTFFFMAVAILAIPFLRNKNTGLPVFLTIAAFVGVFSFMLYYFSGNKIALAQWFAHGKEHYQLQVQVNQLGGIDGIIKKVQKKLDANPKDAAGWLILGKLYLGTHDYQSAKVSFKKAHELAPENREISHYYVMMH